jgi:hydrogenase nickel incorporation protein HypA/HybF
MHELGIMTGVMESATASAEQAGALRITNITLSVGEMTEAIEDALHFAFDVLTKGTMAEGATLTINMIAPRSVCLECGAEFDHDRLHMLCPECGGAFTQLIRGKELQIDSIEVDLPDEEE